MARPVAISAHRGGAERHPAGSWEAYSDAPSTGAEYVEFDVRRLADGRLVCHHDPQVGGTPLAALSYRQLCDRAGREVPTVAGVMAAIAGRAAGHVDLKESGYEDELIRVATALLGPEGFVVSTVDDRALARIRRRFPAARTALTLGRDQAELRLLETAGVRFRELYPLRRVRACGAGAVAVEQRLARAGVLRSCARHGIGTMVWTVDRPGLVDRFLSDPRVDVLVTNRPGYAAGRRTRLGAGPGA